jgi:hypothetical protein
MFIVAESKQRQAASQRHVFRNPTPQKNTWRLENRKSIICVDLDARSQFCHAHIACEKARRVEKRDELPRREKRQVSCVHHRNLSREGIIPTRLLF